MWPFTSKTKNYLGIDIGTSSLKIVELSGNEEGPTLVNYVSCTSPLKGKEGGEHKESFLRVSTGELRNILEEVLNKIGFKSEAASISVPIYSTFTTVIELPVDLKGEDLKDAIKYEAKKHVPVSLSEVMLEWHSIEQSPSKKEEKGGRNSAFVVAIPKDIVEKYQQVGDALEGLDIELLEIEIFSMARVAARQVKGNKNFVIIDIGGKNTNVTLAQGEIVIDTFNVNVSGEDFTRALMNVHNINFAEAEAVKQQKGLKDSNTKEALQPLLKDIIMRIKRKEWVDNKRGLRQVILGGGSVKMPGLQEFFQEKLDTNVSIIYPWVNFNYPKQLKEALRDLGPSYAVACGLALRGLA